MFNKAFYIFSKVNTKQIRCFCDTFTTVIYCICNDVAPLGSKPLSLIKHICFASAEEWFFMAGKLPIHTHLFCYQINACVKWNPHSAMEDLCTDCAAFEESLFLGRNMVLMTPGLLPADSESQCITPSTLCWLWQHYRYAVASAAVRWLQNTCSLELSWFKNPIICWVQWIRFIRTTCNEQWGAYFSWKKAADKSPLRVNTFHAMSLKKKVKHNKTASFWKI